MSLEPSQSFMMATVFKNFFSEFFFRLKIAWVYKKPNKKLVCLAGRECFLTFVATR